MTKTFTVERRPITAAQFITLKLPFPPSVNAMYFNLPGKGRVKTGGYHAWIKEGGMDLLAQRVRRLDGPVRVEITLDDRRSGDADNRTKAVLDLLVAHGVIDKDDKSIVRSVSIGWGNVDGALVTISRASRDARAA